MAVNTSQSAQAGEPLSHEKKSAEIERVLSSKYFANAPMKRRFLRLICDFHLSGRGAELNEYLIGREVFDRNESYNPATDPIVRVGAHGIREKLTLYYQTEGAADEIRIEIPIGSYEPAFILNQAWREPSDPPLAPEAIPMAPAPVIEANRPDSPAAFRRSSRATWVMFGAMVLLSSALLVLLYNNLRLRKEVEAAAGGTILAKKQAGPVWSRFLQNPEPTLLVLSNPMVHRALNTADPEALAKKSISLSPEQASVLTDAMGNRLPLPRNHSLQLIPAFNMYTGIGEAVGIYRISALLHAAGETTILKQSRSITPDDLKSHDAILLGSVYANQWSKPLSIRENFIYTNRSTIENLAPRTGEEREYRAAFNPESNGLIEDHALITVVPGVLGERMVMVIAGIYSEGTEAAADFISSPNRLAELNQALETVGGSKGPTQYFQALLKVRVENSFPTKTTLVTVRELQPNTQ